MTIRRRVVVTGSRRGLGLAMVEHFLARGDAVVGCSVSEPSLEHEAYRHVRADVSSEADVSVLFRTARDVMGGLDLLVNNAGVATMNPLALSPLGSVRRMMDVNFLGTVLCTRAAVRLLRTSPAPRNVNLSTVAVPMRLEGEAIYAATKSAVETLTRVAARELAPLSITCNAVGPSPVRTDLTRGVPAAAMQALLERQAVKEWAQPQDVINVIEFFASAASGMVTGQVVYLGGAG